MHHHKEKYALGEYRSKFISIKQSFPNESHRAGILQGYCKSNNNKNCSEVILRTYIEQI